MSATTILPLLAEVSPAKAAVAAFVGWLLWLDYKRASISPKVEAVGRTSIPIPILGSWIAAFHFLRDPVRLVTEAAKKTKNGMFLITTHQGEYVLVTDRAKVSEYLRAPDNVLSMQDGANDQQQIPFTMGYGIGHRTYHTAVVKGPVTRKINAKTPDMIDEATLAMDDIFGSPEEYTPFLLYNNMAMIVARIANRIYVGTKFCRNEAYLRVAIDYAEYVVISAELIKVFPDWFKSFIVRFMPCTTYRKRAETFLADFIQKRLDGHDVDENGEAPDDLLQWLIDAAPPIEKTMPQLSERIMALNVGSIHTTVMTFTGALYILAENPEKYVGMLREEVEANLQDGKITLETLGKLPKMDSFLREAGRSSNLGLMAIQRNARQKFTFSDGTVIPKGAKIGSPTLITHYDPEVYVNPEIFDPLRSYNEAREQGTVQKTLLTTGPNFNVFGAGRHPCPGRFLATHEMKLILSMLLLRYDFKFPDGVKAKPLYIGTMALPDTFVEVLFRKRRT
ncbi:cytochrome P450 [Microdochium bolleyi]|uniref:Cytochrome P450 n=1 Tax=Microdochium bolleyi TaxID=196109 RepID=A0A136J363_9PEZI|nr:cytochrome P450 [Microdochium bolleyi]